MNKRNVYTVLLGLLLTLSILNIDAAVGIVQGGVSFDLSVTVAGTTLNVYHYQKGSRYNWGIQQWGYAP